LRAFPQWLSMRLCMTGRRAGPNLKGKGAAIGEKAAPFEPSPRQWGIARVGKLPFPYGERGEG